MQDVVEIYGPQFSTMVRSVALVCEEKGLPYQVGMRLADEEIALKSARHLALHPFAKLPVIQHQGQVLFETAPICRYLDGVTADNPLQPESPYQIALVDQWCQALSLYVDQVLVRQFLLEFAFPKGEQGAIRMDVVAEVQPKVVAMLATLETQLGDKPFFCTDQYTVADALLTPMLDYLGNLPMAAQLFAQAPNLHAYIERMRARASGQNVLLAKR